MIEIKTINEEDFGHALDFIKLPASMHRPFIYEIYQQVIIGLNDFGKNNLLESLNSVNQLTVIGYLVNEHYYGTVGLPEDKVVQLEQDEKYIIRLASVVMDKYLTNEHLAYREIATNNRFSPPISTMKLYLNFVLGMLSRFKKNNPSETLIVDMLSKAFSMGKCITDLLINGFETEAFSTWRTLHETECIVSIIAKYGQPVIERYLRHMTYGIAFRNGIPGKEKQDAIFVEIKANMKALDLKSKDMKRYIEYGWLLAISDVQKIEGFKFNFRDGVERVAELTSYSSTYEMSSEIAHSSPLLIYSRKKFFNDVTLVNLYESFFRIEKIFFAVYTSSISPEEREKYLAMRNVYYTQMVAIHQREKGNLVAASKPVSKSDNEVNGKENEAAD